MAHRFSKSAIRPAASPIMDSKVAIIARRIAVMSSREVLGRNPAASIRSCTTSIILRAAPGGSAALVGPRMVTTRPGCCKVFSGTKYSRPSVLRARPLMDE